jgi:hypothetical protein
MESKKTAATIIELLEKIYGNLETIGERLEKVVDLQEVIMQHVQPRREKISLEEMPLDAATLLSLPDHLRKTAMAICKLGEATATDISGETGRVRAVESDYLNQLVGMGHLKKKRKSHDVIFYIER